MKCLPMEVHLHTNNTCTLQCLHCYNGSGCTVVPEILPVSFVLECLKWFYEHYDVHFHLEGGEIFLRQDLLSAMNGLPDEVLGRITLTTNGTIAMHTPEILDMLRKLDVLRVSVEGHTNAQQQAVRRIDLDNVVKLASFYMEEGVPVSLRVTLNRANYEGFVTETLPTLYELGFHHIQVYEFQRVGRGEHNRTLALDQGIGQFLTELASHPEQVKGSLRVMFPIGRRGVLLEHKMPLEQAGFTVSDVEPESSISIHANGDVYLCPWDDHPDHCVMNLLQTGLDGLDKKLEQMELVHTCGHCSALRIAK